MPDTTTIGQETVELVRTILDTHHVFMREHMPGLRADLDAAAQAAPDHGPTQDFAQQFRALAGELGLHLEKEEQVLFPMIEELNAAAAVGRSPQIMACGVHGPVAQMRHEHTGAKQVIGELLAAVNLPSEDANAPQLSDDVRDAVRALEADLQEHIRKEDDLLFPKAEALFDAVTGP